MGGGPQVAPPPFLWKPLTLRKLLHSVGPHESPHQAAAVSPLLWTGKHRPRGPHALLSLQWGSRGAASTTLPSVTPKRTLPGIQGFHSRGCLTSGWSRSAQFLSRCPLGLGPPVALTWILGFGALKSVLANPGSFCSSSSKGVSSRVLGMAAFSRLRAAGSPRARRLCRRGPAWMRVLGSSGVSSSSLGERGPGGAET